MNAQANNKQGTGPLFGYTSLDVWEVYARLTLQFIDPITYKALVHADKPDLIDREASLGVEVTQAISSNRQEAEALYSLYSRLRAAKTEEGLSRTIERIEQVGGKLIGTTARVLSGPKGKDCFDLVIDAFREKTKKLNGGGYSIFNHNHLFVRSDIYADEQMLADALAQFSTFSESPFFFERVIVSVPEHNYDFDITGHRYTVHPFCRQDQIDIAIKSRAIVEKALRK